MHIEPLIAGVILAVVVVLVALIYLTDPFNRFTIIKLPFRFRVTQLTHEAINNNHKLSVHQGKLYQGFAIAKSGWHILHTRYIRSDRSDSSDLEGILADIHKRRFDPSKLLVISGDHFNSLFVRNLGVFYYPLLDSAPPLGADADDWADRQSVYIQTVAYALGVYAKMPIPSTTIVPTGALAATCVNFYAYPSDTVYGILYALAALLGQQPTNPDATSRQRLAIQTKAAAKALLAEYGPTLQALYAHYRQTVYDSKTGLIRTNIHLSGAKDITRRSCSFYDNVIFWKTTELMQRLGLLDSDQSQLDTLKRRILDRFWLESHGHFIEDLSPAGIRHRYYSSDWLVVLFTGFLSPYEPSERAYFERSFEYIHEFGIDKPFGLKYQHETRSARQFLAVRMAVASYGGDAIWSFWGMEYIKSLALMANATGKKEFLDTAEYQLEQYRNKIVEYGGFPEVYDAKGKLLQTPLYRSINQTGWVVGFEQATGIVERARRNWPS